MAVFDGTPPSELREARAWLERARSRCAEPAAARFLDLILQRVQHRLGESAGAASPPMGQVVDAP